MIDLLSKKTASGALYLNIAMRHLRNHEWGLARKAVEDAIAKGGLSAPVQARTLLSEIQDRLVRN